MRQAPTLRVARPAGDLEASRRFYCDALGFHVLARFDEHDGFSGLILGYPTAPWHLELTTEDGVDAGRSPGPEHLLVLYLPDKDEWRAVLDRMLAHDYEPVASNNPYWDRFGRTFEDPDGYRLVVHNAAWDL